MFRLYFPQDGLFTAKHDLTWIADMNGTQYGYLIYDGSN